MVTLIPINQTYLPVIPDLAPNSEYWYLHAAVRLKNGVVVDPLLLRFHDSVQDFKRAVVGDNPVFIFINGIRSRDYD